MFARNTEGLCGFMDDDDTNDLTGPNGEQYNDTIQFAESCKYHSGLQRAHFGTGESLLCSLRTNEIFCHGAYCISIEWQLLA
jgi:hypothetical protein